MTFWHLTFSTYGARLHGDDRPTVDRDHNERGTPFLAPDSEREAFARVSMSFPPIFFTLEQRCFIEETVPSICERGKWTLVLCAAGPDHVHTLLGADEDIHGKQIRRWFKHWLTRSLDGRWSAPVRPDGMSWWCEGGSTKPVTDELYFASTLRYIRDQRATPAMIPERWKYLEHYGERKRARASDETEAT
jgi:REP element-mobilizing transposase RayT